MDEIAGNEDARSPHWQLDEVMDIASRLAGHDAVGAIHVVVANRPTYDDILHYRRLAEASRLSLTVTADSVVLWPPRPPALRASEGIAARATVWWMHALRSALGRVRTWPHHHADYRRRGDDHRTPRTF